MGLLTFENTRILINSLSIGKNYKLDILKLYGQENNKDIISELEHIILTIDRADTVDDFYLHNDLRELFENDDTYTKLAEDLNRYLVLYDNFGYCFMYHARNSIKKLDERTNGINKPESVIHNYLKLSPKQPEDKNNISDNNTKYKSIMSKMYLSKYNKYVDENDKGAGAWTFQLSITYLIIIDTLYRLLQPYITDVADFFFNCMITLNPIITGLTYTTEITSEIKALEYLYELMQLTSNGSYLIIKKNEDKSEVTFIFTTKNGTFTNYEQGQYAPTYRHDNNGKRLVEVKITGSGNRLFLKVDIVGLEFIKNITELPCEPSLFSLNTDENYIEIITYRILGTMLSHTEQFKSDLAEFKKNAQKLSGEVVIMGGNKEDTRKYYVDKLIRENVFKSLRHETLLRPLLYLQEKVPMERYNVTYYRYVVSALRMTDSEISGMLKLLGSKQQAEIRKMINEVKSLNYTGIPALHYLYKVLTYRG